MIRGGSDVLLFRLQVTLLEEGVLRVLCFQSPAGEAEHQAPLPFQPHELKRLQRSLDEHIVRAPADDQLAWTLGEALFQLLFGGPVGLLWHRSLDEAERRQAPLRLELRGHMRVLGWPWEFLRAPDGDFVPLSARTPLARYVPLPEPEQSALLAERPLKVLLVQASPEGLPPLDLAREQEALEAAFSTLHGGAVLEVVFPATFDRLHAAVRQFQPHVLHLGAHGDADGFIYLGEAQPIPLQGKDLARLVADAPALRLVVLNACRSAEAHDGAASAAERLVRAGVPAVIAMQRAISDGAAAVLARELYGTLAEGYAVETALAHARQAMAVTYGLEWSTPMLFLRTVDSHLWRWVAGMRSPAVQKDKAGAPVSPPSVVAVERRTAPDGSEVLYLPPAEVWFGPPGKEQRVKVEGFWIGRAPVTNAQYARFVAETGHPPPPHWGKAHFPEDLADHPVVFVSRKDAEAYCRWAEGRLPTEREWERAARGADGREWPWGNQWEPERANTADGGPGHTTPVGAYPHGATPEGVLDLAGNVWEWTANREPEGAVAKGGSWFDPPESARTWERMLANPEAGYDDVGFRCAWDDLPEEPAT